MSDFYNSPIPEILPGRLVPSTVTLIDAASIALDASLGDNFFVLITAARALAAPTNCKGGQRLTLLVKKTNAGDTLTFDAAYNFNGATPALNAGAGSVTPFFFVYDYSTSKFVSIKVNTPIVTADIAAGALSADATGRAIMADAYFNAATVLLKFAGLSVPPAVMKGKAVVAKADADVTATAAELYGSGIFTHPVSVPRNFTLDTTAAIIAAFSGQSVGAYFDFAVINTGGASTITVVVGDASTTAVGSLSISNTGQASATFRLLVTGAATLSLIRIG